MKKIFLIGGILAASAVTLTGCNKNTGEEENRIKELEGSFVSADRWF